MKWPWGHSREDAENVERAERELQETRSRWPLVHRAVAVMDYHRERNHFRENIESIYRGAR
ncbi:hypothetical protein [Nocardioides sp. YIM 152315]|uniref:DUF7620 family protein n=1 Tax=Nocardioides sp. YIM 152315 TaxID=3031760 RepID=UPI0023DA7DF6|nr:hypothetical protein [Nocardioides sp. YIM 152315]MDF1603408.1 hypothetical protein [Nocardioides sp. YIM 152315]